MVRHWCLPLSVVQLWWLSWYVPWGSTEPAHLAGDTVASVYDAGHGVAAVGNVAAANAAAVAVAAADVAVAAVVAADVVVAVVAAADIAVVAADAVVAAVAAADAVVVVGSTAGDAGHWLQCPSDKHQGSDPVPGNTGPSAAAVWACGGQELRLVQLLAGCGNYCGQPLRTKSKGCTVLGSRWEAGRL